MIKTAVIAMTILGCDCDAKLCEYIGETAAKWSTIGECEAAMKRQILHERNSKYPLISGICRTKGSSSPSQPAPTASRPLLKSGSRSALPPELSHRRSIPVGSPTTAMETAARPARRL
ncbi:hypothetical protein ACWGS9_29125 [Bradyrhizobium sp. Arg314]